MKQQKLSYSYVPILHTGLKMLQPTFSRSYNTYKLSGNLLSTVSIFHVLKTHILQLYFTSFLKNKKKIPAITYYRNIRVLDRVGSIRYLSK